ncbi:MAG: ABC transporter ATP-binding protein [Oligoflexus sp.]
MTKYYPTPHGRKYVLRDVSVTIPSGVNVAILGVNGSGKSTLLRLLGGIDNPNSGKITIDMDISWPMGLAGGLQGSMSGRDNAKFVCRIFGDSYKQMQERIKAIAEYAELGKYFDMPVKTYSSGMNSKIKLGISLAFEFDCYLFDELGSVGDALFRKKTQAIFSDSKNRANFILVSHNINELIEDCQMALVLHDANIHSFDSVLDGVQFYYSVTNVQVKSTILKQLQSKQETKKSP